MSWLPFMSRDPPRVPPRACAVAAIVPAVVDATRPTPSDDGRGTVRGKSSLAAFVRVGAVVGGVCYGVVVNGFTGISEVSGKSAAGTRGTRGRGDSVAFVL